MTSTNEAANGAHVTLFKVVSARDEIIIGLSDADILALGKAAAEAVAAIGQTLASDGQLTAWQFAVRKAQDGALEYGHHQRVSILAHDSLRIEPFPTSMRVAAN